MQAHKPLILGIVGALMASSAFAADMGVTYTDPGFDWDGFYAGLNVGGSADGVGGAWVDGFVELGGIFSLTDDFKVNVALEGGGYTGTTTGYQIQGTTRLGYTLIDDLMLFLSGGVGTDNGSPYYAYGAGAWFAVSNDVSVRVEGYGATYFGSSIVDWAGVKLGAFYHF